MNPLTPSEDEIPQHMRLQEMRIAFVEATWQVQPLYFQIPVAGKEDPQFRERVYCYELYHQMRLHWPKIPQSITGEIDKSGHPWIRGNDLDNAKPDFTIHVPGETDQNLLVIEVKAGCPSNDKVLNDLRKLSAFVHRANYFTAYYLIYGCADIQAVASRCGALALKHGINLSRISLFSHESPGTKAVEVACWK